MRTSGTNEEQDCTCRATPTRAGRLGVADDLAASKFLAEKSGEIGEGGARNSSMRRGRTVVGACEKLLLSRNSVGEAAAGHAVQAAARLASRVKNAADTAQLRAVARPQCVERACDRSSGRAGRARPSAVMDCKASHSSEGKKRALETVTASRACQKWAVAPGAGRPPRRTAADQGLFCSAQHSKRSERCALRWPRAIHVAAADGMPQVVGLRRRGD